MNLIWINKAQYLGDYRSAFHVLQDKERFKQFALDGWTVSWMSGTLDIAPEYLYEVCN